jgi:tRNA threonylcarbamoyladenosine biosynthesis protein TsaE
MRAYKTKSTNETRKVAKEVAGALPRLKSHKRALVLGFEGELGAGKTTFIKALMRAMGVRRKITSPTFIILRKFKTNRNKFKNIFHIDAYRTEKAKELSELGINEIFSDPQNLVLVEWADKIKQVLPKDTIWVKFNYGKERDEREIIVN